MGKTILFLLLAIMSLISSPVLAQTAPTPLYYINVNQSDGKHIEEIAETSLNLVYDDRHGRWQDIPLTLYNWKRERLATLPLNKASGVNHFSIPFTDLYATWEMNMQYYVELQDETGHRYSILFRRIPAPVKEAPALNIIVNPLSLECQDLAPSVVEFYGEINGGKAPYTVNWYVLNAARTDFLFQPREQFVSLPGKTPMIVVDSNPEYYVVLYVVDACGAVSQKVVNLVCQDRRKRINSIFVQDLDITRSPLLKGR